MVIIPCPFPWELGRSAGVPAPGSDALTLMGARRGAGAHPYEAASARVSRRASRRSPAPWRAPRLDSRESP
jgi:hypothetical protein